MTNSVPYLLIFIFIVLIMLALMIGVYHYGLLDIVNNALNVKTVNNYRKFAYNGKLPLIQSDNSDDANEGLEPVKNDKNIISENVLLRNLNDNESKEEKDINNEKTDSDKKESAVSVKKIVVIKKTNANGIYAKGSNVKDFNFHSYGEFVSDEEKEYRKSLIENLKIKTIVINSVTKGNGISQEYYRIAYQTDMIPAKILDVLVESKEFREMIPEKYRTNEFSMKGFKKGENVKFKNSDIIRLLYDWSLGKLTPVSKAWKVKAEK